MLGKQVKLSDGREGEVVSVIEPDSSNPLYRVYGKDFVATVKRETIVHVVEVLNE